MREIHTATLMCAAPSQYAMTTAAAEISAHRVIDEEYQFCQVIGISLDSCTLGAMSQPCILKDAKALRETYATIEMKLTYVPSDRESQGIIHVSSTELRNGTRKREPSCHLTQTLHHAEDGDTGEGITQKNGERSSTRESTADA
jgi:hypothetical protein